MSATKIALTTGVMLLLALLAAAVALSVWRPGMDRYAELRAPNLTPDPAAEAVSVTWFGVTAVLIRAGEHAIFIDPFFSRPPGLLNMALNGEIAPDEALIAEWLARAGIRQLDAVLVSHSHFDHAMDAGVVARLTGAPLLGSPSTANIGFGAGLKATQLWPIKPGEPLQFGPFRITFIDSRHAGASGGVPTGDITAPLQPPAHYLDYKLGGAYSILIQHARGSVLHHGSAGFIPGALKAYKADVVLLGAALIDDLETYVAEVVTATGARRVLPTHWDDFTRPLDAPLRPFPLVVRLDKFFAGLALHPELQVQTLELAQPAQLF